MPKKNPHAVKLGRLGGLAKSAKKAAAARENAGKRKTPKKPKRVRTGPPRRSNVAGLRRRRSKAGYKYEIEPGVWVSRQRVWQVRNKALDTQEAKR